MTTMWEKIFTLEAFQKKNTQPAKAELLALLAGLPEVPGVYFFLDVKKNLLYIGKATSLRDRVKSYYPMKRAKRKFTFVSERSAGNIGSMSRGLPRDRQAELVCNAGSVPQCDTRYFSRDILTTRGLKIGSMLKQVRFIAYQETDSVLEALILEARLIKVHQPPYNTDAKDDKSYKHIVITQEKFPRVLIVRGRDIEQQKFTEPVKYLFGPFPSGGALREALKIIRKLFPFRDKCEPFERTVKHPELVEGSQRKKEALRQAQGTGGLVRPCFSAQIGLCPGVCTGAISAREYGKIINHIRLFFEGHKNTVVKQLEREMKTATKQLAFERAGEIKKILFGLQHIQDMALIKDDRYEANTHRIEAYDVAHLGGTASVGVMVVVQQSTAETSQYRQFKLRGEHNGNDLTALEEILRRRLNHPEWPLPDIIVVDGGELQFGVAEQVLREMELTIPIVGVVKNAQHQPERLIGPETLTQRFKKEILLSNSEAHRFAITFHRKRRGKEFLGL